MEVHHHSHHPKKWKEYITEFLMLFLAVSMGFLAENVREERVIEHQTQNVILQLRDELMKDSSAIHLSKIAHSKQDSATIFLENYILKTELEKNKIPFFYLHNYLCTRQGIFETNCIAIDQLKFAGVLKNVKDKKLRDGIENYDLLLLQNKVRSSREEAFMNKYIDDLRIEPFNYYYRLNEHLIDTIENVKGTAMSFTTINYHYLSFAFKLDKIFLPDQLVLKNFDKDKYLSRILQLNGIRMSTNSNELKKLGLAAKELLLNIERVYPDLHKAE
jgi:hypothetical protein